MPRHAVHPNAKPQIERLEDRCVPAGDVFAGIVPIDGDDVLLIQGDQHDNDIAIAVQSDGTIIVQGRDDTTINGMPSVSFTPPFLLSPIIVDLGDGDDVAAADCSSAPASVRAIAILTGRGSDEVSFAGGSAALGINTGDGDDSVVVEDLVGGLSVQMGDGNDSLVVRNLTAFRCSIDLGRGHDFALLANLDLFELYFDANAGNDVVEFRGNSEIHGVGQAVIDLGNGNDSLEGDSAAGSVFLANGFTTVVGGQGRDSLSQAPYFDGAEVIGGFEVIDD